MDADGGDSACARGTHVSPGILLGKLHPLRPSFCLVLGGPVSFPPLPLWPWAGSWIPPVFQGCSSGPPCAPLDVGSVPPLPLCPHSHTPSRMGVDVGSHLAEDARKQVTYKQRPT